VKVIGLFIAGPNTAACLFIDGKLIAMAEEERFNRIKTSSEIFPTQSIKFCLKEANLKLNDIDEIALGWNYSSYPEKMNTHMSSIAGRELDPFADTAEGIIHAKLSPELTKFNVGIALKKIDETADVKISWHAHHKCHVASTHYLSGFDSSAILVMDGSGEEIATSTWHGQGGELSIIDQWDLPHSLGWFYSAITEWLGFSAYSGEGKVMGLAPYGNPNAEVAEKLKKFCVPDDKIIYKIDPTYVYYGKRSYSRKFTDKLVDLLGAARRPESEMSQYYIDVAYEVQKRLEDVAINLAKELLAKTGERKLCVSGGVAMNCKMNGLLSNLEGVDDIFINPASYDAGAALGAALLAIKKAGQSPTETELTHAYWGPSFSDDEIESALKHCGLTYTKHENIAQETAKLLNDNKIIGWFQGKAEFGARALGARSIIANPMHPDMKDIINKKVKYREGFRPFAPSMIAEVAEKYMIDPKYSPFMILAYQFKDEYKELFPSIVHVDDSVRPQTVTKDSNPIYWETISKFGELSGYPVVLNTSFNIRGEPIVNTPLEAVRCFYSTGMDALAIGSFLLKKTRFLA